MMIKTTFQCKKPYNRQNSQMSCILLITFDFRQFGDWVIYRLINIHVILCNVFHEYIEFQIL